MTWEQTAPDLIAELLHNERLQEPKDEGEVR